MHLPGWYKDLHSLSSDTVTGKHIRTLWNSEIFCGKEIRSLRHLNYEDLYPDNFHKMNVGSAIRLISLETAAALEFAVQESVLPQDAVATARFIRDIVAWFGIVSSKCRKTSITKRNHESKIDFLQFIIDLFQGLRIISEKKGRKRVRKIISTKKKKPEKKKSAGTNDLIEDDEVLGGKKVKKQKARKLVKKKVITEVNTSTALPEKQEEAGKMTVPSIKAKAKQQKTGWKPLNTGVIMTTLSFIDLSVNLLSKPDFSFVLGHRFTQDALENVFSQVRNKFGSTPTAKTCLKALKCVCLCQFVSDIKRTNYAADSDTFLIDYLNCDKTAVDSNGKEVPEQRPVVDVNYDLPTTPFETLQINEIPLSTFDVNLLYNIAGSCQNFVTKTACNVCKEKLLQNNETVEDSAELSSKKSSYKNLLSQGGLKDPSNSILCLILNLELVFRNYRWNLIHNSSYQPLVEKLIKDLKLLDFNNCCDLKCKLINHFFIIRCYSVKNASTAKKRKNMFGTSTSKKRKCN